MSFILSSKAVKATDVVIAVIIFILVFIIVSDETMGPYSKNCIVLVKNLGGTRL